MGWKHVEFWGLEASAGGKGVDEGEEREEEGDNVGGGVEKMDLFDTF